MYALGDFLRSKNKISSKVVYMVPGEWKDKLFVPQSRAIPRNTHVQHCGSGEQSTVIRRKLLQILNNGVAN